jgi:UDP-N-acetylglucosamine 1-carboxyvinyltransferase
MTDFRIQGGKKLSGSIACNTSKNGAMGLVCAALINKGATTLHGIPRIEEISRMLEVFKSLNITVEALSETTLKITPPKEWDLTTIQRESASKMRSVLMLLGSLVHDNKDFLLPHAGGCNMGDRTIAAHKHGLEALGVHIETLEDNYHITNNDLLGGKEIIMYEASDTAAINLIITAARIPGKTIIKYAPPNYQVQDVCYFLEALGVKIEGIGTHILTVHGLAEIDTDIEFYNSEDPIEAMCFITAAIMTRSELTIERCSITFLEVELLKLSYMGLKTTIGERYLAKNNKTHLVDITVHGDTGTLTALNDKVHPLPYPGLNVDNLPFFAPIATQAEGMTLIHDWMWESRAIHFTELTKLGAQMKLLDPHRVEIVGKTTLVGAQVICPPALRPAVIVMMAMLGAQGESVLRNVYSIARGYENIAERLNAIGASIDIIED